MQEKMKTLTGGLPLPPGLEAVLRHRRASPCPVAGPEIERLIQLLARLPGLGPRSARRAALHLIKKREQLHGAAGDGAAGGDREDRRSAGPAAISTPRIPARSAPTRGAIPRSSWWSPTSPICGRWSARTPSNAPLSRARRRRCRRSTASVRRISTIDALVARAHDPAGQRDHPGAQRHGRRPDHRALHHRSAAWRPTSR